MFSSFLQLFFTSRLTKRMSLERRRNSVSVQSGLLLHHTDQFRCLSIKQLVHTHRTMRQEKTNETRGVGGLPVFFNPHVDVCAPTHFLTPILHTYKYMYTCFIIYHLYYIGIYKSTYTPFRNAILAHT